MIEEIKDGLIGPFFAIDPSRYEDGSGEVGSGSDGFGFFEVSGDFFSGVGFFFLPSGGGAFGSP